MQSPTFFPRIGHAPKLQLSLRGRSSEAAYRSEVSAACGPSHRSLVAERTTWAQIQGLHPDDGAYLVELSLRPLTIDQLGEALALYCQTREMVNAAVDRLVVRGFLHVVGV